MLRDVLVCFTSEVCIVKMFALGLPTPSHQERSQEFVHWVHLLMLPSALVVVESNV